MRFELLLVQFLPFVPLAHTAAIELNTLSDTCIRLKDLSTCKFKFNVPTGFNITTKTVSEQKYNKCKSKKKEKRPCPTKKKPKRMCEDLICVPGNDTITKSVPTGLKVLYEEVDLCETVRKVLGQSQGDKFIRSHQAICKSFPRLDQLNTTAAFKSFSDKGVISPGNAKVFSEIDDLIYNVVRSGFNVDSDEAKVKKTLQSTKTVKFAKGPEILEYMYLQIAEAMDSCKQGACDEALIEKIVNDVMVFAIRDIAILFRYDALIPWKTLLGNMQSISQDLDTASIGLKSALSTAQDALDSNKATCEKLGSCKGPAVSAFIKQVEDILAASNRLLTIRETFGAFSNVEPLLNRTVALFDNAEDLFDVEATVALFKNGKVRTAHDFLQLAPIIKQIPILASDINTGLDPFRDILAAFRHNATSTFKAQEKLTKGSFAKIEKELSAFETEDNLNLIQTLYSVKDIMQRDFSGYLFDINLSLEWYEEQLNKASATNGRFSMQTDVVSYQRWINLPRMSMPCSRLATKTYSKAGFSKTLLYPEYFKCTLGGTTSFLPKVQLPYIRLTV